MTTAEATHTVQFLRWHPAIPEAPTVALCDLLVNGQFVEGVRLLEDRALEWWGKTLSYGSKDYFLAPPARGNRASLRPARWAASAADAVLPRMVEL